MDILITVFAFVFTCGWGIIIHEIITKSSHEQD